MLAKEFKANDKMLLANFNLKLIGGEPIFLPGVNSVTKMPDGSVRNYSTWEISTEKTDSTEAKTAKFKLYQSYDFDADGKILYEQSYGDLSAVISYLTSK